MVFGWSSFRRTFDHMEWDINHNWRWPSVIHFYRTLVDCLILPFAVIAFLTPTRTLIALSILRRAWANKNETTHVYERIRGDFFLAGLSAPLDIVGIAAALLCAMLPWPTCIFRLMTLGWKRADGDVSSKVQNMNQRSSFRNRMYCA